MVNQAIAADDNEFRPAVESGDRLSFTIFLALVLHGLVLLGLDFKLPELSNQSQTIEITLATHKSLRAPDDADFLAQHNQEGSGTIDEAKQITTVEQADFAASQVREVNPLPQQQAAALQVQQQQQLSTRAPSQFQTQLQPSQDPLQESQALEGLVADQPLISAEIASLQAKLDRQRQEYAKRPRIRILTSVSTKASFDAKYLHDWSERIEQVGTSNYPSEALRRRITGQLRLSVVVNPDGSIYEVNILQSSGQRLLDDAARQIVRLASPFAAFPSEIRQQADRLQIIRTWNFEINGGVSSLTTSAN